MNNERRADLEKATTLLEEAKEIIENAASEEQDYFDNMPEGIQASEKGDAATEAFDNLETAKDAIDEILDNIIGATSQ